MKCAKARPLLLLLVYDEIEPQPRRRLEQHLERCENCRRELEALRKTHERVLSIAPPAPAPKLRTRVLAAAREVIVRPLPPVPWWRRLWAPVPIAAAAAVLIAGVGFGLWWWSGQPLPVPSLQLPQALVTVDVSPLESVALSLDELSADLAVAILDDERTSSVMDETLAGAEHNLEAAAELFRLDDVSSIDYRLDSLAGEITALRAAAEMI